MTTLIRWLRFGKAQVMVSLHFAGDTFTPGDYAVSATHWRDDWTRTEQATVAFWPHKGGATAAQIVHLDNLHAAGFGPAPVVDAPPLTVLPAVDVVRHVWTPGAVHELIAA